MNKTHNNAAVTTMGFWMDNATERGKHIIVDCGYMLHPKARENADRLIKALGFSVKSAKRHKIIAIVSCGRVLVRVPWSKESVLEKFQLITRVGSYAWTTHTYEREGQQFDLKWATK